MGWLLTFVNMKCLGDGVARRSDCGVGGGGEGVRLRQLGQLEQHPRPPRDLLLGL